MHCGDARLAPGAALEHALHRFERMESVGFHITIPYGDGTLDVRPERQLQLRYPHRYRDRRAGHKWKLQLARLVIHLFGVFPGPGQVLIREDGNHTPAFAQHFDDLLEELVARIQLLPHLV